LVVVVFLSVAQIEGEVLQGSKERSALESLSEMAIASQTVVNAMHFQSIDFEELRPCHPFHPCKSLQIPSRGWLLSPVMAPAMALEQRTDRRIGSVEVFKNNARSC